MQRLEIIDMLGKLKLAGMRANFDDIVTHGRKRKHGFERGAVAIDVSQNGSADTQSVGQQLASGERQRR